MSRVATQAAKKKGASRRSARRRLIARLEKEAADSKSRSFDEQPGGGKGSADDQYDRKKNLPKPKGDDANLDYPWEQGEGYPHSSDAPGLGSGGGEDLKKTKQKQKALDESDEQNKKNTSEMEPYTHGDPSRPRPKLSSAKRRAWRKKKIAQLKKSLSKTALTEEELKVRERMEKEDAAKQQLQQQQQQPREKPADEASMDSGKAAFKIMNSIGGDGTKENPGLLGRLANISKRLHAGNEELSHRLTEGKSHEMAAALGLVMSPLQDVIKYVVPEATAITKLMHGLQREMGGRTASTKKAKRYRRVHANVVRFNDELSRARTLVNLAVSQIRI
jgi:hypothetical protein